MPYRGRFAPSPTGPLHFGSLIAATASYLDARQQSGEWLVRIEDIDTTRCQPGAADEILRTLDAFGFRWDEHVIWQTQRNEAYEAALSLLRDKQMAYPCACSRKAIAAHSPSRAVDGGDIYPGTCRNGLPRGSKARAWRLRAGDAPVSFNDRIQGSISQNLGREVGDFILRRADGLFAYQLAVVVDDHFQGISDVVRGADLLASTPRQIFLQQCLGYPTPRYAHLPVATNPLGEKWSKQTLAPALSRNQAATELVRALRFLGQNVPGVLARSTVDEVWAWATAHWEFSAIPRTASISAPANAD